MHIYFVNIDIDITVVFFRYRYVYYYSLVCVRDYSNIYICIYFSIMDIDITKVFVNIDKDVTVVSLSRIHSPSFGRAPPRLFTYKYL